MEDNRSRNREIRWQATFLFQARDNGGLDWGAAIERGRRRQVQQLIWGVELNRLGDSYRE